MFRVTSFLLALVGLFFAQAVVAQDDFQFTYSIGKTKHEFQLSIFSMELKELKSVVKNTFEKNQKKKGSTAYWATSSRKVAGKVEKYYSILEYPNMEEKPEETITHIYDEKGKWLYSLLLVPNEDKQFWGEVQGLMRQYTPDDTDLSGVRAFKVKTDATNLPEYVIEFGYLPLKEAYIPTHEFDVYALRLLLDKNRKLLHEAMLFGNSSELFELNFVAPIFVK